MDTSPSSLVVPTIKGRCLWWLLVVCTIAAVKADMELSPDHETPPLRIDMLSSVTSTEDFPATTAEGPEPTATTGRPVEVARKDALSGTPPAGDAMMGESSKLAPVTEEEEMMVIEESVAGAMKSKGRSSAAMNSMDQAQPEVKKDALSKAALDSPLREERRIDVVGGGVKSAAGGMTGAKEHPSNSSASVADLELGMEDFMTDMQEIESDGGKSAEADSLIPGKEQGEEEAGKEPHSVSHKSRGFAFNDKDKSSDENGAEQNAVKESALTSGKNGTKSYEMMTAVLPVADYSITGRKTPLNVVFVFPHVKNETRKKELEVVLVFPQNETTTEQVDTKPSTASTDTDDDKELPEASEKTETSVIPEKKESPIRRDVYKKYASKYAGMRPPVAILKRNQELLERNTHRFKVQRTTTSHPMEQEEGEEDPMETGASELVEQVLAPSQRPGFRIVASEQNIASVPLVQAESAPQPSITVRPPPGGRSPGPRPLAFPRPAATFKTAAESNQSPAPATSPVEETKPWAMAVSEDVNRMPLYIPTPIQASHQPPPFPSLPPASIRPMVMRKPLPQIVDKHRIIPDSAPTPNPPAVTTVPSTESTSAGLSEETPATPRERPFSRIRPRPRPNPTRRQRIKNETLALADISEKGIKITDRPTNATESPAVKQSDDLLRTKPRVARPDNPIRARQEALRSRKRNPVKVQAVPATSQGPSPAALVSRRRPGPLPAKATQSEEASAAATENQPPARRSVPRRRVTGPRNSTAVAKEAAITAEGSIKSGPDASPAPHTPRRRPAAARPGPAPTEKGNSRPPRQNDPKLQEKLSTLQSMLVNKLLSIQQDLNRQQDALHQKAEATHGAQRGLNLLPRPDTTPAPSHAVSAEEPSTATMYRGVKRYRRPPSFRKVPVSEDKEKEKKASLKNLYKKNTIPKVKTPAEDSVVESTTTTTTTTTIRPEMSSSEPATAVPSSTAGSTTASPAPATSPAEASSTPAGSAATTLSDDTPTELTTALPDTTVPVTTEAAPPASASGASSPGAKQFSPSPQDPAPADPTPQDAAAPHEARTLKDRPVSAPRPEDDLADGESLRRQDRSAFRPPAQLEGGLRPYGQSAVRSGAPAHRGTHPRGLRAGRQGNASTAGLATAEQRDQVQGLVASASRASLRMCVKQCQNEVSDGTGYEKNRE